MKLHIKNIAKVAEAEIDIEGITVIAGENNTGKSTVGKALFTIFNSFNSITQQIRNDKIYEISRVLSSLYDTWEYKVDTQFDSKIQARRILDAYTKKKYSTSTDVSQLQTFLKSFINREFRASEDVIDINIIFERIIHILSIENTDYTKEILGNRLKSEFHNQINNIKENSTGTLSLQMNSITVTADICDNEVTELSGLLVHKDNAIYIDNPFAIDEATLKSAQDSTMRSYDHKSHLLAFLSKTGKENSAINSIIVKNKLASVYEKLSKLIEGDLIFDSNGSYGQKIKGSKKILDVRNVSAGLKAFMIIKALLQNGSIEEKGTLILDEPEIHLHPVWQLLFAELIVLLQKEFNLHILLTTHSPYFLRAIEVFSQKYDISHRCRYYLAENHNDLAVIRDVSAQTEQVYKLLSAPFQTLENERWKDD